MLENSARMKNIMLKYPLFVKPKSQNHLNSHYINHKTIYNHLNALVSRKIPEHLNALHILRRVILKHTNVKVLMILNKNQIVVKDKRILLCSLLIIYETLIDVQNRNVINLISLKRTLHWWFNKSIFLSIVKAIKVYVVRLILWG